MSGLGTSDTNDLVARVIVCVAFLVCVTIAWGTYRLSTRWAAFRMSVLLRAYTVPARLFYMQCCMVTASALAVWGVVLLLTNTAASGTAHPANPTNGIDAGYTPAGEGAHPPNPPTGTNIPYWNITRFWGVVLICFAVPVGVLLANVQTRFAAFIWHKYDLGDDRDPDHIAVGNEQHDRDMLARIRDVKRYQVSLSQRLDCIRDAVSRENVDFVNRFLEVDQALDCLLPLPSLPVASRLAQLPCGYHLCMSSDSGLVRLDRAHSFLFHADQVSWARRYEVVDRNYADAVYISDGSGTGAAEYKALDRAIRASVHVWLDSMIACQTALAAMAYRLIARTGNPAHYSDHSTGRFVYPRAIRLVCASAEELVESLYQRYKPLTVEDWILTGPASGVMNVWLPEASLQKMRVDRWTKHGKCAGPFLSGEFDAEGRSSHEPGVTNATITLWSLIQQFRVRWSSDQSLPAHCRTVAEPNSVPGWVLFDSENHSGLSPTPFLVVGDQCAMVGPEGEETGEMFSSPDNRRAAFLSVLPIVLMTLHCTSTLSFDWLFRLAMQHRTTNHKPEAAVMRQALAEFEKAE